MSRPKSKSMSDFLVTFFVDNRAFSQLLSDVLKNKHQAVFNETLGLPSDFIIPFSQEENRGSVIYTIKANLCGDYDITLNGQPCSSCVIHSGDYFSFTHKDKRKAVKALLIATSEIQAGYKKYQVSKIPIFLLVELPSMTFPMTLQILFQEKSMPRYTLTAMGLLLLKI